MDTARNEFAIVGAATVSSLIREDIVGCLRIVREAYLAHNNQQTISPESVFLRFPERPTARIIGLAAHLRGPQPISGLKWIASYPENVRAGLARASAVVILNDAETGFPTACLEGSVISAVRTAASAVIAAECMRGGWKQVASVSVIGAGLIARYVVRFLLETGWQVGSFRIFDTDPHAGIEFAKWLSAVSPDSSIAQEPTAESACRSSELILFATVARIPHVFDVGCIAHRPVVLHLSLRDLGPQLVLAAENVVDDIEHAVSAGTSLELAAMSSGHTEFIRCNLAELLLGRNSTRGDKTVIFSPFGLGILDVAMGQWLHGRAAAAGRCTLVKDFFPSERAPAWG